MITYSSISGSIAGIVNEIVTIISAVIGILVLDRKEKKPEIPDEPEN